MRYLLITALIMAVLGGCTVTNKNYKTPPPQKPVAHQKVKAEVKSDSFLAKGINFYNQGKYFQAEKMLTKSIVNDRNNWEAHYYLGLCQQQTNQVDRSLGTLNSALKLCPLDTELQAKIHFSLGLSWELSGYYEKAQDSYQTCVRLNPKMGKGHTAIQRMKEKIAEKNTKKAKGTKAR